MYMYLIATLGSVHEKSSTFEPGLNHCFVFFSLVLKSSNGSGQLHIQLIYTHNFYFNMIVITG